MYESVSVSVAVLSLCVQPRCWLRWMKFVKAASYRKCRSFNTVGLNTSSVIWHQLWSAIVTSTVYRLSFIIYIFLVHSVHNLALVIWPLSLAILFVQTSKSDVFCSVALQWKGLLKVKDTAVISSHLRTTGCRLPYGITQYYLPPDTSEHTPPLPQPVKAGTWFTYPRGMEGWVDLGGWLHTEMVYPPADGHPSKY